MMHARRSLSIVLAFALLLAPAPWAPLARADEPSAAPSIKVLGVGRVRLELTKKQALIVADVNVARGGSVGGGGEDAADETDLFFAFGAPGAPRAVEAWLVPVAAGALEPGAGERGASLAWSYAREAPAWRFPSSVARRWPVSSCTCPGHRSRALSRRAAWRPFASAPWARSHPRQAAREWVIRLGDGAGGRSSSVASRSRRPRRGSWSAPRRGSVARACSASASRSASSRRRVRAREPGLPAPVLSSRKAGEDLCIRVMSARAP
ncbi:MAG: hypothetical protein U0235_19990 [Polyangiaceae bacterium]